MKRALGYWLFVAVLCLLAGGCRQRGPVLVDDPRSFAGVRMQDVTFRSPALGRDMTYRVYLPAELAPGRKLPAVYLLHGGGGGYKDWSNYSDVGQYAARGYVLIMPEGGSSYWVNAAGDSKERFGDYLTSDLLSDVERRFPVSADRSARAVVGVSMGGYAAMELAPRAPGSIRVRWRHQSCRRHTFANVQLASLDPEHAFPQNLRTGWERDAAEGRSIRTSALCRSRQHALSLHHGRRTGTHAGADPAICRNPATPRIRERLPHQTRRP
jgi:pimeloyl-ACP methyl ester carboxylesterase